MLRWHWGLDRILRKYTAQYALRNSLRLDFAFLVIFKNPNQELHKRGMGKNSITWNADGGF